MGIRTVHILTCDSCDFDLPLSEHEQVKISRSYTYEHPHNGDETETSNRLRLCFDCSRQLLGPKLHHALMKEH